MIPHPASRDLFGAVTRRSFCTLHQQDEPIDAFDCGALSPPKAIVCLPAASKLVNAPHPTHSWIAPILARSATPGTKQVGEMFNLIKGTDQAHTPLQGGCIK
jgi:hypothetical protein